MLGAAGCASPNVNPPQARARTGYVDFQAAGAAELFWQVERFDDPALRFKKIVSELAPPAGGFLRLAFPPGSCRLRITVLNRVIARPAEIDVEVPDGNIVPIRVQFTPTGSVMVATREKSRGGTAKGRYGRRTQFGSDETARYNLSAVADLPVAYQFKEQMPYAR